MNSKELLEKRATVAVRMNELRDTICDEKRKEPASAEENENFKGVCAEYDNYSNQIDIAQRTEAVNKQQAAPANPHDRSIGHAELTPNTPEDRAKPTDEQRVEALQTWCSVGSGKINLTDERRANAELCGLDLSSKTIDLQILDTRSYSGYRREQRAQSVGLDTGGGYTVPEGFMPSLEQARLFWGGMRQVSDVMRTATGNDLPWPTSDDTSNTGALLTENAEDSEQDVTFGQIMFHAYKYTSKLVKVSSELLQDSAFNFASVLGQLLGERLGRIENTHFTTGDGASKPNGIITAATSGKTTASATAITSDEVLQLIHSVDVAYRNGGRLMFHDNTLLALRLLKDGEGKYLFQPNAAGGPMGTIHGFPFTVNNDMASTIETTNKTIIFGQLKKYKIRDVASINLKRLNERYAEFDQVAFVALMRLDGNLLDAGQNPVKFMTQA